MYRGGRDILGSRAASQEDEDEAVNYHGAKHAYEYPEVIEPETFILVGRVDPTLSYCQLISSKKLGEKHTHALART